EDELENRATSAAETAAVSRWPGSGELSIMSVALLGPYDKERAIFNTGEPMKLRVIAAASADGDYEVIPAALIFRVDGVVVTRHIGYQTTITLAKGDTFRAELDLGPLLLGTGDYAVSVGLYRRLKLDHSQPSEFYDYLDRSYE